MYIFIKETGDTGFAKIDANGCVRRFFMDQPLTLGSGQDFAMAGIKLGKTQGRRWNLLLV